MTPPPPENDSADMLALQRGEDLALNRLMNRWQRPLRSFLHRWTRHEQDASDLAQQTFVRIYQHRKRFRPGARFSTWMFQIALNLARDHARYARRHPVAPLETAPEPSGETTPGTEATDAERAGAVRSAIAGLPVDLREVVLLAEYEDKSHAEIAVIVGASAKAVESRLSRARGQLRKTLAGLL